MHTISHPLVTEDHVSYLLRTLVRNGHVPMVCPIQVVKCVHFNGQAWGAVAMIYVSRDEQLRALSVSSGPKVVIPTLRVAAFPALRRLLACGPAGDDPVTAPRASWDEERRICQQNRSAAPVVFLSIPQVISGRALPLGPDSAAGAAGGQLDYDEGTAAGPGQEIGRMAWWDFGTALSVAATCTLGWCLAWCVRRMRRRRLLYNASAIEGPTQSVAHLLARLPPFVPHLPPSVPSHEAVRPCSTGRMFAPAPSAPEWQQDQQPSSDNSSQQPPIVTAAPWRNRADLDASTWRHPPAAITGADNVAVTHILL
jgi:hypothetical protein